MTKFEDNISPYLSFVEHVDPSNPSAGRQRLFVDTDHLLKMVDSAGTVTVFGTGLSDPMTTRGDIIVRNASNVTARLPIGSSGKVLSSDGTDISWQTPSGGGGTFSSYDTLISAMSGLVHRWKFEDASGNFADSVGSLTMTVSGTTPTYSVSGGPVSGGSGSVTFGSTTKGATSGLGSIPIGANDSTIVAVYKAGTSVNLQPVASYGTASTRQALALAPGYVGGAIATGIGFLCWSDDTSWTQGSYRDGTWHMSAISVSNSQNVKGFHDGVSVSKFLAGSVNIADDGTHFTCGTCQNAVGGQFRGTMDDLAVFTRVLQPYELQQLFNALVGALP